MSHVRIRPFVVAVAGFLSLLTAGAAADAAPQGEHPATAHSGVRGCAAARRLPDRPLRVGLVTTGPIGRGPDGMAYSGLRRAVRELGVEGLALEQGPKEDGFASLSYLARRGFDLVVGFGATQDRALDAAALRFPRTCFLMIDGPQVLLPHKPRNLQGTHYAVEQASYLAGYLAALVEKMRPGPRAVSSVGGLRVPPVDAFIAGFQAGARQADPKVRILNGYANNFANPRLCRTLALRQIARGSGVVFQAAGACGLGALEAARNRRVWGVGVDEDQSALGPHVLTSVLKRFDVAVLRAVRALKGGTFRTGTTVQLSLRNWGVGLGRISVRVPRSLVAKLAPVRRQILAGRIRVPTRPLEPRLR